MKKLLLALLAFLPLTAQSAMKVSIVQAAAATGTPTFTQDFTDSTTFGGATPKCAIVLGSAATANNSSTANIQSTIGFIASAQASIGISDNDAVSTNAAGYANYSTQAYSMPDFGGNTSGDATGAMIANGVRLSWTDQSAAELVNVILIGGDVECAVASLTSNNTTSAQAVTHGLTAAPQAIIAMTPGQGSGDATGNARYGLGFWDGTNSKTLAVSLNQTGQATVTAAGHLSSTVAIGVKANAAGFVWTGAISNVGATTFDLTTSANTTNVMHFLSLRSTSGTALGVKAGTFGTKTSTGTNADISGMSQAPQLVLYGLSRTIAVDTNYSSVDDASVLGLGAAAKNTGTGSTQYATIVNCSVDGAATSTNHAYSQTSNTKAILIPDASSSCSADVEATINSWDSGGITNNYSNIAATGRQMLYLAIGADTVTAPTWSVSPTVSAQDDNDYTLSYTPSTSATFYAVACVKDSTAPTIAQVKAGNCTGDVAAVASVNEAVTGADTTVLGGSLTYPIHDLYAVLSNAGGDSTLVTLADEMLDAPTGYQYDLLTSVSTTSPCKELNDIPISPTIATADVVKTTTTVSPGGETLTTGADCEMQYLDSNGTRRTTTLDVYDTTAGDWMSGGPTTIYFNNDPPTCVAADCLYDTGSTFINGNAIDAVDLTGLFTDSENDTLTITTSDTGTGTGADKRTAGTTITSGDWTGTPSCASGNTTGSFTTTATDIAGDTETVDVTWTCYDQVAVPDVVDTALTSAASSIEALNLTYSFTSACSNTIAALNVISQDPAATTSVNPFTNVHMVVSTGTCATRAKNISLRFMP